MALHGPWLRRCSTTPKITSPGVKRVAPIGEARTQGACKNTGRTTSRAARPGSINPTGIASAQAPEKPGVAPLEGLAGATITQVIKKDG